MRRIRAALLLLASAIAAASQQAHAAPPTTTTATAEKPKQSDAITRALDARRFEEAETLIEARIADGDRDPILLYNSACVLAQLGKLAQAEKRLLECVKAGFRDFDTMEADTDLEPIRASRTYEAIMEARERVESKPRGDSPAPRQRRAPAPDPVARWKEAHGDKYRYDTRGETDDNIAYATCLDEASHARMKTLLADLEKHLIRAYFGKPPQDKVLVAVVRPEDAKMYLDRPEVRGMYLHSERRLVTRDAGQSLQHEFVHLMHFAQLERIGQRHPIWVQEGLASLYEDYDLHADGSIEFRPNVRFNIARRQVVSKTAEKWPALVKLSPEAFMQNAERLYPQVRSMFEFFAREGKLEEFYRQLCATWKTDPTGTAAIEKAFGEPIARVEDRWRKWMIDRGAIDDSIGARDASLGITIEDAVDGVRIKSFVIKAAARSAGLRVGDVVIAIGGIPVRNREEMLLAVARLKVGEAVEVKYKRDGKESVATVTPRPLGQ